VACHHSHHWGYTRVTVVQISADNLVSLTSLENQVPFDYG